MTGDRYEVIDEIPYGWDCGAKVGDILIEKPFHNIAGLFLGNKLVCDPDSQCCLESCKRLN